MWFFRKKRKLDANPVGKESNKAYPVDAILGSTRVDSVKWKCYARLNQGKEGACVGFGISHFLAAKPIVKKHIDNEFAFQLYEDIKRNDRLPGEDYDGTFTEDGLNWCKNMGYIKGYRWCLNGWEDIPKALQKGPLVIATPIYHNMAYPAWDAQIKPSGKFIGWHCWLIDEYDAKKKRVWFLNSWGKNNYGWKGRAWMSEKNAKILFDSLKGRAALPYQASN